ncbi:MAG: thymidylate synthase [Anaerolineae bacterium]
MIHVYEGQTADEVWQQVMEQLMGAQSTHAHAGRGGSTVELLHAVFCIGDPRQRWIVSRHPPLNPAFAIAEVIWILNGRNDAKFLNYWNRQLPKFAGYSDIYHGAYGFRLRRHFGVDQLERAFLALQNNSSTRQVVLQIWDPAIDFPNPDGEPVNPDIPCNILSMLKVRNGKLEWLQVMRSNDIFRGLPHNVVQFTSLHEIVAGWLGIEVGSYHHLSDSLHLYQNDLPSISVDLSVHAEQNPDSLMLPKRESERVLDTMAQSIDHMIQPVLTQQELEGLARHSHLPAAYHNLLLVLCAEAARRRAWAEMAQDIIARCTNPALVQAWQRWYATRSRV